jgi:hypothetical protein
MDEPVSKKPRRDFCKKILTSGKRCSFPHLLNSEYCKRHTQATTFSVETNTENLLINSSTNTEGTILDVTTANETVLCMLDELAERDKYIKELEYKYNQLKEKVVERFIENT